MLHQNQDTKRLNTTEVILPTETSQDGAGAFSITMPVSHGLSGGVVLEGLGTP
jgi:hypothetical protein